MVEERGKLQREGEGECEVVKEESGKTSCKVGVVEMDNGTLEEVVSELVMVENCRSKVELEESLLKFQM